MPQFTSGRRDPYKTNRFEVRCDGEEIPGVLRVSGLHRVTQVVDYRDGDDPAVSVPAPGSTSYNPIIIERAVTHDDFFEQWANKIVVGARSTTARDFRRHLIIRLLNEAGEPVMAYILYDCWPSEYLALSDLDAHLDVLAIERLVLQCERWERDPKVREPT